MIDLHLSPDVCDKVDYAIFTGQLCLAEDAMYYHIAKFRRKTGKNLKVFVFNKNKKRNAKKGIYMEKYRDDFSLDMKVMEEFVEWLKN